jgi:hypothetical protein
MDAGTDINLPGLLQDGGRLQRQKIPDAGPKTDDGQVA